MITAVSQQTTILQQTLKQLDLVDLKLNSNVNKPIIQVFQQNHYHNLNKIISIMNLE